MLNFPFRISVLIPVYNAESTLDRTLQSLYAQTIPQADMEILLIDDGSSDNSAALCDTYAAEHENIKVIHQENSGVSVARNAGIQAAQGKYILFLDSDDTITPETVKNVADFFDKHYNEVDLVTYPLTYIYENGDKILHWRYRQFLKTTNVYSLAAVPGIIQTTINVCIKNNTKNPVLFNTNLEVAEDQLHNTTQLSEKATIGFVKEAGYNYFVSREGTITTKKYSHTAFENYLIVHQKTLDIGNEHPAMKKYCEYMVLYDFQWMVNSDCLLPYGLTGDDYNEAMDRFVSLVNQIPNQTIINFPHMDQVHRFYFLSLKTKNPPILCCDDKVFAIADSSGELFRASNVLIVITRSSVKDGKLYLLAHAKNLVQPFVKGETSIWAIVNGNQRIKIETFDSSCSHYHTKMLTSEFPGFHFEIELDNVQSIKFEVEFNEYCYPTTFYFMEQQGLKNGAEYYLTDGKYKTSVSGNKLLVQKGKIDPPQPAANKKINLCRKLMGNPSGRIWLYCDRAGVIDNAYHQFKHDFKKKDGIKRYYVFDEDINNIKASFSAKERKHLIRFNSIKHKLLYSKAEYVLTSFVDAIYFRPFDTKTFAFYRGVCNPQIIYLQHGILHAKTIHYSKERLEVDKIVISGEYEKDVFSNQCGFREKDLIMSGMPRLDLINRDVSAQKKILYAPSWREYLMDGLMGREWRATSEKRFKGSKFFNGIVSLLSDEKLKETLEKEGYTLELKLHPIFSVYKDLFQEALPDIAMVDGNVKLEEYAAFITDFSSFLYDFAYLNRPIFYYVPDIAEFRSGINGYRELYIPFEKALGYYSSEADEMAEEICRYAKNQFVADPVYIKRINSVFSSYEPTHAATLYNKLMEGEQNEVFS